MVPWRTCSILDSGGRLCFHLLLRKVSLPAVAGKGISTRSAAYSFS
jgi:hypothetical protein